MRVQAKANAPYGQGISKAAGYDVGVHSACSDLEGLIDRYGKDVVHKLTDIISEDLRKYGDSIYNREWNAWLKGQPYPKHRKRGATRNEQLSLKRAIEQKRAEAIANGKDIEGLEEWRMIKG